MLLTGTTPALLVDARVTPPAGTLTLTGVIPTVAEGGAAILEPLVDDLELVGVGPRMDLGVLTPSAVRIT